MTLAIAVVLLLGAAALVPVALQARRLHRLARSWDEDDEKRRGGEK